MSERELPRILGSVTLITLEFLDSKRFLLVERNWFIRFDKSIYEPWDDISDADEIWRY